MDGLKFIQRCTELVYDTWHGEKVNVFVVWSCKAMQNNKAILATIVDNLSYLYEFTYNGDKQVIYMDLYSKDYHAEIQGEY